MRREEFYERVYAVVEEVPEGKVTTYGKIAKIMGAPQCSRMVGRALYYADFFADPRIPCHRVVNGQGRLAPHWEEQRLLLEREGVCFKQNGCVNLKVYGWGE